MYLTSKPNTIDVIRCPKCKGEFVHFPKITLTLEELEDIKIDYKGNLTINTEKDGSGEHYSINLHYSCEQGHKGIIRISHHEGTAYIEAL
jgi:hypothetical protein